MLRLLDQLSVYDCVAGDWQPRFESMDCAPLVTESGYVMHLDGSEITIDRAISDLGYNFLNYFGQLLCSRHGEIFTSVSANTVRCFHEKRLSQGPDEYQGLVQVKLFNQWQSVCPTASPSEARHICSAFGYHYTSLVLPQRLRSNSNKTLHCTSAGCRIQASSRTTSCRNMLRCRRRCDSTYNVHDGYGCSESLLEGERCYQNCNKAGKTGNMEI